MMKGYRKCSDRGFSLIEVILAMAILALVTLPLLRYFSDSLKYSHMMAVKQEATALCQQTVEDIKSADNIIAIPDGGTEYSSPYLEGKGFSVVSNSLLADGKGRIELENVSDPNYDVYINLTTDVEANAVERPAIYGIDETQDVLAVEREQLSEAVMYFMALNNAHVLKETMELATPAPGADPAPAPSWLNPLTEAQVLERMTRTICVDIDYITATACYVVRVYYEYECKDLRVTDIVTTTTDSMTSSYLADVQTKNLSAVYLLYDRTVSSLAQKDTVRVTKTASVPLANAPELVPVCQNMETDNSAYILEVDMPADYLMPVRSNILTDTAAVPAVNNGHIKTVGGVDISTNSLTGSGAPVRIVEVETIVYPKGGLAAGEDPYIQLNTTKGE